MSGAVNRLTAAPVGALPPSWGRRLQVNFSKGIFFMNKLLVALIAAAFATTGAFANEPAKKDAAAKPAAAASAAKKDEKKAEMKKEEMKKDEKKTEMKKEEPKK
jgi:hypothetical protein